MGAIDAGGKVAAAAESSQDRAGDPAFHTRAVNCYSCIAPAPAWTGGAQG